MNITHQKPLESPLDSQVIRAVNPKGNQSWIFIGRTDAETGNLIPWWPDAKCRLIDKDSDAGKDWGQEEKGVTKNAIVGWHRWLNGHESEQTPGDSEGQGRLACRCPHSRGWGGGTKNQTCLNNKYENKILPFAAM